MTGNSRLLVVLSLFLSVSTLSESKEEDRPSYVRCTIKFWSGKSAKWNFVNRRLSFETIVGTVNLWMHELSSMTVSKTGKQCTVNTIHRDTWDATLADDAFEYYYLDSKRSLDLFKTSIRKISFSQADQTPWRPKGNGRILFNDLSTVSIDLTALTLKVKNSLGIWKLPVGSTEIMQFLISQKSDAVDVVTQFPSGRTERFRCADQRPWFLATDTFGNRMKVRYEDMQVIKGREGIHESHERRTTDGRTEKGPANLRASEKSQRVRVISKDGRTQTTRLPASVWTMKGSLGIVLFPSTMLREINTESRITAQCAVTVYGEYFFGDMSPRTLTVPIVGSEDKYARLNVRNQRRISFSTTELPIPEGWHLFRMRDGNIFCGRFIEEDIRFVTADAKKSTTNLTASSIASIHKLDSEDSFYVVLMDEDTMMSVRPASRHVELALMVNGMKCTVPWDDLRSVILGEKRISRPIKPFSSTEEEGRSGPFRLGNLFGARQKDRKEPGSSGDEISTPQDVFPKSEVVSMVVAPRHPGELGVETGIGTIKLRYSIIREIFSSPDASVSCFVTVYGDTFVGKRLSKSQLTVLFGNKYKVNRSGKMPRLVALNNKRLEPPSGALAWRLTTGDMFYARFAEETIEVSVKDAADETVTIDTADIFAVAWKDKALEFNCRDGIIIGRPESGEVSLRLLYADDTRAVPIKFIECARRLKLAYLPPPVTVISGVTPLQEGVVKVEGGSFKMGRKAERIGMPDEIPQHEVLISEFYIDACEITKDQFERFTDRTGYATDGERVGARKNWKNPGFQQDGDEPVTCVSWYDAVQYCNWRSKEAGLKPCYEIRRRGQDVVCHRDRDGYRLPTESEWEYAVRSAGMDTEYPWWNDLDAEATALLANFRQEADLPQDRWTWTNPVKAFAPNNLGLYGMAGNVWEWCDDWYYDKAYAVLARYARRDPCMTTDLVSGLTRRVMRGGSFHNELDLLRCASRGNGVPYACSSRVGFRCVRSAKR